MKKYLLYGLTSFVVTGFWIGFKIAYEEFKEGLCH